MSVPHQPLRHPGTSRPLASSTRGIVDAYWAAFFGCDREALRPPRALAVPHAGAADYAGAFAVEFGGAPLVSLPASLVNELGPRMGTWESATIHDPSKAIEAAAIAFGTRAHEVIGPAYLGYADDGTLGTGCRCADGVLVRLLSASDVLAVEALRDACTPREWEHGGSELGLHPAAGAFVAGELTALAGYEVWGGRIAHLAVLAHPGARGRGYARAAVAAVARHALDHALIPQYRTLDSNHASRAIADSLGFVRVATSVAVKFGASRV